MNFYNELIYRLDKFSSFSKNNENRIIILIE